MELTLNQVTKYYGSKTACSQISLTLTNGIYGLLGANGAGKTTLMRMMCGILNASSGSISFDGIDVQSQLYRDQLGYLPQEFGYYPEFCAEDFMLYLAALKGLTKGRAKERTKELLALVSLEKEAKRKIKTFSGGMKQRLGIAQALLNDPKILILDEPTKGLDPKERIRFRNLISTLGKESIVLLSTHIVSDVEHIAGTILIMKDGQLLHQGTLEDIISTIEGKVWELRVPAQEADRLIQQYPVVNLRQEADHVFLRLVSQQKPCPEAVYTDATLEDLYLYYFSEVKEA